MIDKASPKLYQTCAEGTTITSVILDFCMTNVDQDWFCTFFTTVGFKDGNWRVVAWDYDEDDDWLGS